MRGPAKSSVKLTVERGTNRDVKEFTIVRQIIHVQSVRSHLETGDIGYIRVTQFNQEAYDGVRKAFDRFRAEPGASNLKGYILDLRNNPGGLLNQAVEITNAFVDSGDIVSTRGRSGDQMQRYSARPGVNLSQDKPLVVLINGGSASASEIVSGALQDLKRATLIGTRSFGKGSVQTILPLGENGALKLTTARYYTPSGRSIQAKGIDPDISVLENIPEDLKGKVSSMGEASLTGHLKNVGEEEKGSDAYVPPDRANDTATRGRRRSAARGQAENRSRSPARPRPSRRNDLRPMAPGRPTVDRRLGRSAGLGSGARGVRMRRLQVVARQRARRADPYRQAFARQRRDAAPNVATTLELQPLAAAGLPRRRSGRRSRRKRSPAISPFAAPAKPGIYRITISSGGWIDVLDGDAYLHPKAFTGAAACEGARKSVKFDLPSHPLALQFSGVEDDRISVIVSPDQ